MFSAPYTIATAAMTGGFFLDDLRIEAILDEDRRDLMRRVSITSDPDHPDPSRVSR
jgi:2-methylcitrate dehydratase PrpD